MPLIVALILSLGSFIGYTLNDIDKEHEKTIQASKPLVIDFRCENQPLWNFTPVPEGELK